MPKQLELSKITEEDVSNEITEIETIDIISIVLVQVVQNKQAVISRNMVLNLGWSDKNRMKFKDW